MKTYELTEKNWKKYVGDKAVVFEKDGENIKIIGTVQVQRGFNNTIILIPNLEIGTKIYSPVLLNLNEMRDNFDWKTFSI